MGSGRKGAKIVASPVMLRIKELAPGIGTFLSDPVQEGQQPSQPVSLSNWILELSGIVLSTPTAVKSCRTEENAEIALFLKMGSHHPDEKGPLQSQVTQFPDQGRMQIVLGQLARMNTLICLWTILDCGVEFVDQTVTSGIPCLGSPIMLHKISSSFLFRFT